MNFLNTLFFIKKRFFYCIVISYFIKADEVRFKSGETRNEKLSYFDFSNVKYQYFLYDVTGSIFKNQQSV